RPPPELRTCWRMLARRTLAPASLGSTRERRWAANRHSPPPRACLLARRSARSFDESRLPTHDEYARCSSGCLAFPRVAVVSGGDSGVDADRSPRSVGDARVKDQQG